MTFLRIQRKRTKGWRLPANTVSVTRPSLYGNPFMAEDGYDGGPVVAFWHWLTDPAYIAYHMYPDAKDGLMGALYQSDALRVASLAAGG